MCLAFVYSISHFPTFVCSSFMSYTSTFHFPHPLHHFIILLWCCATKYMYVCIKDPAPIVT